MRTLLLPPFPSVLLRGVFGVESADHGYVPAAPEPSGSEDEPLDRVKIGYWPSYAHTMFPLAALDARLYTHLLFAFAGVNNVTLLMEIPISAKQFSASVKRQNPFVKTLISVGGEAGNATLFSQMASRKDSRRGFISSCITIAKLYRFDGIDLDWEFPRSSSDMKNLGLLFAELRAAVDSDAMSEDSEPLLLTAAVYYAPAVPDNTLFGLRNKYPVDLMVKSLDLVNIMCFDYHGSWDKTLTGEHTALRDPASNLSSRYGIETWLSEGLPPQKAVMGLAAYGKSWLLANSSQTGVGAAAKGAGPAQEMSGTEGIMFYVEIEDFVRKNRATVVDDAETGSAYCFAGDVWVGYDNEVSIGKKVSYLLSKDMRGYFFWTASFDNNATLLSTTAFKTLDKGPPVAPSPSQGGDGDGGGDFQGSSAARCRILSLSGFIFVVLLWL